MDMFKKHWLVTFLVLSLYSMALKAEYFELKPIEDFMALDQFESVGAFELYINGYQKDCIEGNSSWSDSMTVQCFVNYELWDRELNKYYRLLRTMISDEQKVMLRDTQRSWIQTKDSSMAFYKSFLDRRYTEPATPYHLERFEDEAKTLTSINKQRAILLRDWYMEISTEQ